MSGDVKLLLNKPKTSKWEWKKRQNNSFKLARNVYRTKMSGIDSI